MSAPANDPVALLAAARDGDRRALGRLLTQVEDGGPAGQELLRLVGATGGRAHLVGITGPPGAGKSSLASALVTAIRATGRSVAVLAVDPSSPITGGAILGDRVRMQQHAQDTGVFIRSMASRGQSGGLAAASRQVAMVLARMGFDLVLVETVGAGQGEIGVTELVDTTLVVEAPGMGDEVQALKAGLMEMADLVVVSKADLPGADRAAAALRAMLTVGAQHDLAMGDRPRPRRPEVLQVSATTGAGLTELLAAVDRRAPTPDATGDQTDGSTLPPPTPVFRPLVPEDDRTLFSVFVTAFSDLMTRFGHPIGWEPTDAEYERRRSLYEHVARTADLAWGAEVDGQLVGYARSIRRGDTRELTEFFVLPGWQGQGIGRQLLERALPADVPHRVIIATFDPSALARYMRHGLRTTTTALSFEGPPNLTPIPAPDGLTARPLSEVPASEALDALGALDLELLGVRRDVDHAWLIGDRDGWLLERAGAVVGYAYGGHRDGPVAVRDPAHTAWAIGLVEQAAATAGRDVAIGVPLANRAALAHLLARGYRLDWFTMHLMEDASRIAFDRYVLTSPPFFL